jgi:oxygen-independent coproporphyrinogen-3 oxidase
MLIRELVLGLKRGRLDADRLARKFGVDPLVEWSDQWQTLESEGYLERTAAGPVLSRRGLLQVDSLLPRFFDG